MNIYRILFLTLFFLVLLIFSSTMVYSNFNMFYDCNPDEKFYVDGVKKVEVNWCDSYMFGEDVSGFAYSNTIYFNNDNKDIVLESFLLHELGHTLGYSHVNGSVMSYDILSFPMKEKKNLSDVTRDIAKKYKGFKIIDWTEEDLKYLEKEYKKGNIKEKNWNKLEKSNYSTIYYTEKFNEYNIYYSRDFYRKPWLYE